MEPVSIQMDEDKRAKMGSLQHTPSFHRCLQDLEATVELLSAWKSFRSRTQLTDCFFCSYTLRIFWLQRWQAEWSKCLFVAISSFLWNSTSSPKSTSCLESESLSGYCGWEKIRQSPVEVGILSHYLHLQGFLHPGWCRISSIKQQHQQLMKVRTKKTLRVVAEVIHSYRSSMLQGSIGGGSWESLLKMLVLFFWRLLLYHCTWRKNIYNVCYGRAVL